MENEIKKDLITIDENIKPEIKEEISKDEFLSLKAFKENAEKEKREADEKRKADEIAKLSENEKVKLKEKEKEIEIAKEQSKKEVMIDLLSGDKDFLDFIHADKSDDLKDYSYSKLVTLNQKYKNQLLSEKEKNKHNVKDTPTPESFKVGSNVKKNGGWD